MLSSPRPLGPIHFVGIGGIGMSALAELLNILGYKVSGSDIKENQNIIRLKSLGITIAIGHDEKNIDGVDTLVVSSAIKPDNPEYQKALSLAIPIVHRADMLAALMRLKWSIAVTGTHGKTTTTSLIAHILVTAMLDPSIISGGIINNYHSNAKLGRGDWLVAEADESDGSFLQLPATVAVVTNIDPEHLDHYGNFTELKKSFKKFLTAVPFYGFAVACHDHPVVREILSNVTGRRIITYGLAEQAKNNLNPKPNAHYVLADNIQFDNHGANFSIQPYQGEAKLEPATIHLPMFGIHNVCNATAAAAVAHAIGIPWPIVAMAFKSFLGVKRRFTTTGMVNNIRIVDDYAHHPTEIMATLQSAKLCTKGRIFAIMQPHRYSRLNDLFDDFSKCFNYADEIIIADVYAAGENPISGINSDSLIQAIAAKGKKPVSKLNLNNGESHAVAICRLLQPKLQAEDLIIFLGAGDISKWAYELPAKLKTYYQ